MIGQTLVPQIKQKLRRRPTVNAGSRAEAKEGEWGDPPWLGGLRGSDRKGETFGGSEEKKGALHADPVGRRILPSLYMLWATHWFSHVWTEPSSSAKLLLGETLIQGPHKGMLQRRKGTI